MLWLVIFFYLLSLGDIGDLVRKRRWDLEGDCGWVGGLYNISRIQYFIPLNNKRNNNALSNPRFRHNFFSLSLLLLIPLNEHNRAKLNIV